MAFFDRRAGVKESLKQRREMFLTEVGLIHQGIDALQVDVAEWQKKLSREQREEFAKMRQAYKNLYARLDFLRDAIARTRAEEKTSYHDARALLPKPKNAQLDYKHSPRGSLAGLKDEKSRQAKLNALLQEKKNEAKIPPQKNSPLSPLERGPTLFSGAPLQLPPPSTKQRGPKTCASQPLLL